MLVIFLPKIGGQGMDENNDLVEGLPEEILTPEEPESSILSDAKIKRIQNLKMFKGWSKEAIQDYFKNRGPKSPPIPQQLASTDDPEIAQNLEYSRIEYEKKYRSYLNRYRKEYDTDMNDANDVQALEALVRFVIQAEVVDENIRVLQSTKNMDSRTLKNMGDFQRSVQQSINELQDKLGISRKSRKDRQVDDFPAYIKQIQKKALDFWQRSTHPIRCEKCQIELARYWLNFPDKTEAAYFEIVCEKCHEKVVYNL